MNDIVNIELWVGLCVYKNIEYCKWYLFFILNKEYINWFMFSV